MPFSTASRPLPCTSVITPRPQRIITLSPLTQHDSSTALHDDCHPVIIRSKSPSHQPLEVSHPSKLELTVVLGQESSQFVRNAQVTQYTHDLPLTGLLRRQTSTYIVIARTLPPFSSSSFPFSSLPPLFSHSSDFSPSIIFLLAILLFLSLLLTSSPYSFLPLLFLLFLFFHNFLNFLFHTLFSVMSF